MKRLFKMIIITIICLTMVVFPMDLGYVYADDAVASGTCGENLTWTLTGSSDYTLTISGTGEMNNYTGLSGEEAPWYSQREMITKVVIENGVTSIGDYAFLQFWKLKDISIPNSVLSIGNGAFYFCTGLTSITIPESVTNIADGAFYECSALESIDFPEGLTALGDYTTFHGCKKLTDISFPDCVTSIGFQEFYGCSSLTNVNIPESVTSIGEYAFYNCSNLTTITIPDTVTNVSYQGFHKCDKLKNVVYYGTDLNWNGVSGISSSDYYNTALTSATRYDVLITNPEYTGDPVRPEISVTQGDTALVQDTDYTVSFGTETTEVDESGEAVISFIGSYADLGTVKHDYKVLPKSDNIVASGTCGDNLSWTLDEEGLLTISGEGEMTSWPGSDKVAWNAYKAEIKRVIIDNGVTSIGNHAFDGCSNLINIEIPAGVTSIGGFAFSGCIGMSSITIPEGVTGIGGSAFLNCNGLTNIAIPEGVIAIGPMAFGLCSNLITVELPDSLTNIGQSVFSGCSGLTSITLPEGVTTILEYTFSNCSSLTSVTIPEGVTYIGFRAFEKCSSLTSILLPENISSINGYLVFDGCDNLSTVYAIQDSYADSWLTDSNLSSLTKYVTKEGEHYYYNEVIATEPGCETAGSKTKTCVKCGETMTEEIAPLGHNYVNGICTRCGAKEPVASGTCGINGDNLTWTLDEEGLLTISGEGEMAVYNYDTRGPWYSYREQIKSIVVESGVETISPFAFSDCSNLVNVSLPEGLISIGSSAFQYCSSITSITVPKSVESIGLSTFALCDSLTSITLPFIGETKESRTAYWFGFIFGCADYSVNGNMVPATLQEVIINGDLSYIPKGSFSRCKNIKTIIIPEGVERIEDDAFYYCSALEDFNIPESVTYIGNGAFSSSGLTNIHIPDKVESIGELAFNECNGIKKIIISDGVKTIGKSAFSFCSNLTSVLIPEGVTSIGEGIFTSSNQAYAYVVKDSYTDSYMSGSSFSDRVKYVTKSGDHYYYEYITTEPTCTTEGINTIECIKCGEKTETPIPAIPHTLNKVDAKEATAIEEGNIEYWYCSVCGKYFADENGEQEITAESVIIPISVAVASGECGVDGSNVKWVLNEEGLLTIFGEGEMTSWSNSANVPWNAYKDEIKTVEICDGVTTIGNCAFYGCGELTDIRIADGVTTIGNKAFYDCTGLTSADIPESVIDIGDESFERCTSLTSFVIPKGVTCLKEMTFFGCSGLTRIIIPESVTRIENNVFTDCTSLTTVLIPESVTYMHQYGGIFANIDEQANLYVIEGSYADEYIKNCEYAGMQKYVTKDGEHYWYEQVTAEPTCTSEGVITIECIACGEKTEEAIPVIPHTLNKVNAKEATLREDGNIEYWICERCGKYFSDAEGINEISAESVVIPKTGGEIIDSGTCGANGNNLTWSLDEDGVLVISGTGEMYSSPNDSHPMPWYRKEIKHVIIEDGATSIGAAAFISCSTLIDISIPDSVTKIGAMAFSECNNLTGITIPEGVTELRSYVFSDCTSLNSIIIPASVTRIGDSAFLGCSSLESIKIPNGVISIGMGAFSECSSLESVIIEEGLLNIGFEAFNRCQSLTSIMIPESVESIDAYAFNNCNNLSSIYVIKDSYADTWLKNNVYSNKAKYVYKSGEHYYYDTFVEATCTFSGLKTSLCVICGEKITEEIPALGHDYHEVEGSAATATCEIAGKQPDMECSRCEDIITGEPIPALGHDLIHHDEKEATCTENGWEEYETCSRCDHTTYKEIPALGHEYKEVEGSALAATCEAAGKQADRKCSHCGETITGEAIPALGHDYKDVECSAVEATCEAAGKQADKKCSRCEDVITGETIPALGHDWGEWTVTKEATTTEEGVETRTCKRDSSHTETRAIPKKEATADSVMRIFGASRYVTSIKSADALKEQLGLDKFDNVIIACGTNYADALAGSYLSCVKKAPILLVRNRQTEIDLVRNYIRANLNPGGTIYMLGGSAVVPDASVAGLSGFKIERLWGKDRYETNVRILEEAGISGNEILVASGTGFADSLSASATGKPILLVKNVIQPSQKAYVESLKGKKFYLIGGTGAVNADIEKYFRSLGSVTRLGGATRFDTSVKVAETFFANPKVAVLAYGQDFPDGLCGGSVANAMGGPLLLATSSKSSQAAAYAKANGIKFGAVLGGPTLINDAAVRTIFQMSASDKIVVK